MSAAGQDGHFWACTYLEHREALLAYALALTGGLHQAHDLIQDVLLRLVRERPSVSEPRAFLLRCLRNAAADVRRRRRLPVAAGDEAALPFLAEPSGGGCDLASALRLALAGLPAAQLEVIVLKVYGELTFQQIAGILERPIGTIASSYARGLDALRARLMSEVDHE